MSPSPPRDALSPLYAAKRVVNSACSFAPSSVFLPSFTPFDLLFFLFFLGDGELLDLEDAKASSGWGVLLLI